MTRTRTHTITTTRPAAVFWQFEWFVTRLLIDGPAVFARYLRPALEQRVVKAVRVYARDAEVSRAEIHLLVDWDEYERRTVAAAEFVVPSGWTEAVSPQLRLAVEAFETQVDAEELVVCPFLSLVSGRRFPGSEGLRPGRPPRLASGRVMCDENLRHLGETRVFFARTND